MIVELAELRAKRALRWLGIMSGTSCDGIDLVQVEIREHDSGFPSARVLAARTAPWSEDIARQLIDATQGACTASAITATQLAHWDRRLGDLFADAALRFIEQHPVDAISLSGHTFRHLPEEGITLQLGNAAIVSERTRLPVVSGFRVTDVARGGEGAPLVPAGDRVLFAQPDVNIAVINIGGISNVTWLPGLDMPSACDCGPGNLILNQILYRETGQPFDESGAIATDGRTHPELLDRWFQHPYFGSSQRSTGREQFGEAWVDAHASELSALVLEDRLRTVVDWIAESIRRAIDGLRGGAPLHRVLLGGGGAHHRALVASLSKRLQIPIEVLSSEKHGVSADAREAAAFAILGHEAIHGRPGSFPSTTGCRYMGPLGSPYLASQAAGDVSTS